MFGEDYAMGDVVSESTSPQRVAPTILVQGCERVVRGTLVMGVVNASPESFSDGGRFHDLDGRLELCRELVDAGADIIDVGGQSAITNRPEVAAEEEMARVVPIVTWLRQHHPDVLVSIDTYKPSVASAALAAGASIVNDVSGLMNPEIVDPCVAHGAALVVMHTRARPLVRLQNRDVYDDVAADVVGFLSERAEVAVARGLKRQAIIFDPGPDFTKTPHQTVSVLRRLAEVRALGRPLLLALSRKDFLGAITGRPPRGRDAATNAAIAHFASTPGNIVRVHDVAGARDVVATAEVLAGLREIDPDYLLPEEIRHEPPRG
jgi:dihydropteroate synthase